MRKKKIPKRIPLRSSFDNSIYGWKCSKCGYFWKIYQNPCKCGNKKK